MFPKEYEDGLQALKEGDYRTAIPLLEQAAREGAYSSHAINHAYTLALYRAGEKNRLADAAFEIGDSRVESDPGMAMDYFQRALLGGLDAACMRHIGQIFERWAAPKPSQPQPRAGKRARKIAHVVGCLRHDHAPSRQVRMLAESLGQQALRSEVFTTEWASSWFFNSAGESQSDPPGLIAGAIIASVDGDFVERAERVAAAIRASGAEVAFYHADLAEQITARVAAFHPAPVQVNVVGRTEMDPALFDGYIHLTKQGLASNRHSAVPRTWIPPASDIRERLKACPPNMRQAMGLESAGTISATAGPFPDIADPRYLRALIGLLALFPQHFHIFVGTGDVKAVRAALHAEGVLPRVRFMGSISDVTSVMAVTDIYLASFSCSDDPVLVEAMGAGKPAVVFDLPEDSLRVPELVAHTEAEYSEIAQRLLRDAGARSRCADLVLAKFRSEFDPANLGPRYLEFIDRILQQE